MSWRRALGWILAFAVVAVAGGGLAGFPGGGAGDGDRSPLQGRVTEVVDGDTVRVRAAGRERTVRYIGVDTPETRRPGTPVECFGRAASARNARLVLDEPVRLRLDREARDRYGRLLAYVYRRRDGLFVNAALVREGYATALAVRPNLAHAGLMRRLERRARSARRGLWRACEGA